MLRLTAVLLTTLTVTIQTGRAEVVDASANGFSLRVSATFDKSPQQVYDHIVNDVSRWWDPSHTYSGDAANLYIEARERQQYVKTGRAGS